MKTIFWERILPFSSLIFLGIVIYKVKISNILYVLNNANFNYLLVLPITATSIIFIQAIKWNFILKHQNIEIEFKQLFRLILIGIFYGSITPGRIGGFIKIRYLNVLCKRTISECSSSVIIDKATDLLSLCFFVCIGSIILAKHIGITIIPVFFFIFLFIVLFIFFYNKYWVETFIKLLPLSFIPIRIKKNLEMNFNLFYRNIPKEKHLLWPLLLGIIIWLLIYTQTFVIAKALSIEIYYFTLIFILSFGSLVTLIPITLNGIGAKEVTLIMILSIYGVSSEITVGMSLINLLLCVYIPALIGGLLSLGFEKEIKEINRKNINHSRTKCKIDIITD